MPNVKFLGLLREAAGTASSSVPAVAVGEALTKVTQRHTALARLLFPHADDQLSHDVRVLVNGRDITFLHELATPLAPDDTVTLFYHGARGFPGG
jgi:molybdopterin converting factor small subunit